MKNLFYGHSFRVNFSRLLERDLNLKDSRINGFAFPSAGNRTPVAIAECSNGYKLVIKLYRRFSSFFRIYYNTVRLSSGGIPVPELLSWSARTRLTPTRRYLTIETFIPGRTIPSVPSKDRPKALGLTARSLAKLHSVKRKHPGWFLTPRRKSYIETYSRRTLSRLLRLRPYIQESQFKRLSDGIASRAKKVRKRRDCELIHGRVNENNFLMTESSAYIIDLLTVHFGDFTRDLVRATHRLGSYTSGGEALFLEEYFSRVKDISRDELKLLEPFYHCDFHIDQAAAKLRSWEKQRISQKELLDGIRANVEQSMEALFSASSLLTESSPE